MPVWGNAFGEDGHHLAGSFLQPLDRPNVIAVSVDDLFRKERNPVFATAAPSVSAVFIHPHIRETSVRVMEDQTVPVLGRCDVTVRQGACRGKQAQQQKMDKNLAEHHVFSRTSFPSRLSTRACRRAGCDRIRLPSGRKEYDPVRHGTAGVRGRAQTERDAAFRPGSRTLLLSRLYAPATGENPGVPQGVKGHMALDAVCLA